MHCAHAPGSAAQAACCFLIDDVCFYGAFRRGGLRAGGGISEEAAAYHRVLHAHRGLYRAFHAPHHEFTAPFGWASAACRLLRVRGGRLIRRGQASHAVGPPALLHSRCAPRPTAPQVHPVELMLQSIGAMVGPLLFAFSLSALWAWLALRQWQGVCDHAGYTFIPFAQAHDDHHRVGGKGNFASTFKAIDRLMGTSL